MRTVPFLMEARGVDWPRHKEPVWIEPHDGLENLLRPGVVEAELKASGLTALGVLLDADDDALARWQRLRDRLGGVGLTVPDQPVPEGWITYGGDIRVGAWLMPDNTNRGMLETFLASLVRPEDAQLWAHARGPGLDAARREGAKFKEAHSDKAAVHSWLAWQDPPGRQLHESIQHHVLDPRAPAADLFVAWFRNLALLTFPAGAAAGV